MSRLYSDEDVAVALAFLKAAGYPDTKGAMDKASRHTGVPRNTLRRWVRGEMHPVGSEVVARKTVDLASAIKNELAEIFPAMADARADASYKDLATAAAIFTDKLQLLEGKPTAINEDRVSDAREQLARKFDRFATPGKTPRAPGLTQ